MHTAYVDHQPTNKPVLCQCVILNRVPCYLSQVLLCEETVSLLGIDQYYKLIGSASSSDVAAATTVATAAEDAVSEVGAAGDAAATTGQQQQPQQLRAQELLGLKVGALLQLLSAVSFHQVCCRLDLDIAGVCGQLHAHRSMPLDLDDQAALFRDRHTRSDIAT